MDVYCHKCKEPWDSYGLFHGDVAAWEADAIIKGAGCPSCEGHSVPFELSEIEMDEHNVALEGEDPFDPDKELKYEQPEDTVIWKCDNCDHIEKQSANDFVYDGRGNIKCIDENNESTEEDGKIICCECIEKSVVCDCCDQRFFDEEDTYYIQDYDERVCVSCYEKEYTSCSKCDCTMKIDDSAQSFNYETYCDYCYSKYIRTCESCDEQFHVDNLILGPREEECCSEDCADDLVEDESELLLEDR